MPTLEQQRKRLGQRLQEARRAHGLAQVDLAAAIEGSAESVSRAERGLLTPSLWVLLRMCDVYGMTLDELVGAAKPPPRERHTASAKAARLIDRLHEDEADALVAYLRVAVRKRRQARRKSAR